MIGYFPENWDLEDTEKDVVSKKDETYEKDELTKKDVEQESVSNTLKKC